MSRWFSSPSESTSSKSSKPRAGPRTSAITPSTSSLSQYVTTIAVEIPSYKFEPSDFYWNHEVDLEKGGALPPNYQEVSEKLSRPNNNDRHSNTSGILAFSNDEDVAEKPSLSQKVFDSITRHAGSRYVLMATVILIGIWVLFGAAYGATDIWQIVIQNASSVQVYVTDILLIRQQHTSSQSLQKSLNKMRSRGQTYARLVQQIPQQSAPKEGAKDTDSEPMIPSLTDIIPSEPTGSRFKVIFDESCGIIATYLGSIWAYIGYWIGIFVWIGIGPIFQFSDTWQLYVNTAVAVALTFTSIFLQNRQQQQEDTLDRALEYSTKIDREVEFRLREKTGDRIANEVIAAAPQKVGWIEKGVDGFAAMMGSLYGVGITLVFFLVWIIVGPPLQYDNNWWLIIGTFTGLIGFIDGFVLRNIYAREGKIVNGELEQIAEKDEEIFSRLNLAYTPITENKRSLASRISGRIGDWTGTPGVALSSALFVVALLLTASAMRWTTTGQLLCNTPTMIIEGFLLLVLIEAHCISDEVRARHLTNVLERRLILNKYLREVMVDEQIERPPSAVAAAEVKSLSERDRSGGMF